MANTLGVEHVAASNGADLVAQGAQLEDPSAALHDPGPTKVKGRLFAGSEHVESAKALRAGSVLSDVEEFEDTGIPPGNEVPGTRRGYPSAPQRAFEKGDGELGGGLCGHPTI